MFDKKILDLLACPKCKGKLILNKNTLICEHDKLSYPIIDDIPVLLIAEASDIGE